MDIRLLEQARIQVPVLCGAMYPCSNPELVASVSEAGGLELFSPFLSPMSMATIFARDCAISAA